MHNRRHREQIEAIKSSELRQLGISPKSTKGPKVTDKPSMNSRINLEPLCVFCAFLAIFELVFRAYFTVRFADTVEILGSAR